MEISFEQSRNGQASCRAGEASLHSAYDPEREAERFLSGQDMERSPSAFVLIGPCLGYLNAAIRKRYPGAVILAIQLHKAFQGREIASADSSWYPDDEDGTSLEDFLESRLDGDRLVGLAILTWPPAAAAFPALAAQAGAALKAALDREASSTATLKCWGKSWIMNACRSFLLVEELLEPSFLSRRRSLPIVVAAAGPSLEASLEILKPHRGKFGLFAVSSALAACRTAGLEPDLTVSTDGGPWSRHHLYPFAGRPGALAAPLVALPSSSLWPRLPILILEQGNFPEMELCGFLGSRVRLPSHGTVAGSALRLAAIATEGPVIAAGLDLASLDLLSHARPHGFDFLSSGEQGRLHSHETALFARERPLCPLSLESGGWRTSRSLSLYARALSREVRKPPFAGRTYRLLPSAMRVEGMKEVDGREAASLFEGPESSGSFPGFESLPAPGLEERKAFLSELFSTWREETRQASAKIETGEKPASPRLKELFRSVDFPDWAAASRALAAGRNAGAAARALEKEVTEFLDEVEGKLLGHG